MSLTSNTETEEEEGRRGGGGESKIKQLRNSVKFITNQTITKIYLMFCDSSNVAVITHTGFLTPGNPCIITLHYNTAILLSKFFTQ